MSVRSCIVRRTALVLGPLAVAALLASCERTPEGLSTIDQRQILRQTQQLVRAANRYDLQALAPLEWEKSSAAYILKHLVGQAKFYRRSSPAWASLRLAERNVRGVATVRVYLLPRSPESSMLTGATYSLCIGPNHEGTRNQAMAGQISRQDGPGFSDERSRRSLFAAR